MPKPTTTDALSRVDGTKSAVATASSSEQKRSAIQYAREEIRRLSWENGNNIFDFCPNLTDTGAAERFAILRGEDVHFCAPWNTWFIYDGKCWKRDKENQILLLSKAVTRQLHNHAVKIANDKQRAETIEYLLRLEGAGKIKAMLELLKAEVPITPDQLDKDAWLLNVRKGVLNLRTGELDRHKPSLYLTKLAPVKYDPQAGCPMWLSFLDRVMAGNKALMIFLQQVVGYALTGDVSEQVVFILYGTGANGKTVFTETVAALLGDYALQTPAETLLTKRSDSLSNDIARLKGVRFVYAVESEQNRKMAEALVKQLTGDETVTARFLHAEFFEFHPECKLFLSTNHKPVVQEQDHAIWRRIRLIPSTVRIPEEEQDRKLKQKLKTELSGILNWALEGCSDWQRNGLSFPEEIRVATKEYRNRMDVLSDFLRDCCELAGSYEIASSELYKGYTAWCKNSAERAVSQKRFSLMLEERDFAKDRRRDKNYWLGVRVKHQRNTTEGVEGVAVGRFLQGEREY